MIRSVWQRKVLNKISFIINVIEQTLHPTMGAFTIIIILLCRKRRFFIERMRLIIKKIYWNNDLNKKHNVRVTEKVLRIGN